MVNTVNTGDLKETIQKTENFGVPDDKIDFKWPKEEDLAKMQAGEPMYVKSISYCINGDLNN